MSVLLPHRRSHTFLLGLLLVDLPVLVAIVVAGVFVGFHHAFDAVTTWRVEHPWSLLPSLLLVAFLVRRWWRA